MLRLKKNRNILCTLRDRELNSISEPYKLSLNTVCQLIRSEGREYDCSWTKKSSQPITYDDGLLYFNNHTSCYAVYGNSCRPSLLHHLKPRSAKKKVVDAIAYTSPVYKTIDQCTCKSSRCSCLSRFILCLTEDNWLCQYNLNTGELMTEVYANRIDCNFKFKYCDWEVYAERVVLTSQLHPGYEKNSYKTDVVVNLAVFTVFPLEFSALLEIKRSVFGQSCNHVNVSDQLLILGMGYDRMHIYSFLNVLSEGNLRPYKLGDEYNKSGKIGMYPAGLPFNCEVNSAPPLLFDVRCFGQSVDFGGFPYHCIFPDPKNPLRFNIQNLKENVISKNLYIESNVWNDEPNIVWFHPDNSNRIISRELLKVSVYKISNHDGKQKLQEIYSMDTIRDATVNKNIPQVNSFGRRINRHRCASFVFSNERCIMATDYDDELDLFGILGICSSDPHQVGCIKLYDSFTGEEVKCVKLDQSLCETNYYDLHINREVLIVIEKDARNMFSTYVYQIA